LFIRAAFHCSWCESPFADRSVEGQHTVSAESWGKYCGGLLFDSGVGDRY
jgi:hypothetical protein